MILMGILLSEFPCNASIRVDIPAVLCLYFREAQAEEA